MEEIKSPVPEVTPVTPVPTVKVKKHFQDKFLVGLVAGICAAILFIGLVLVGLYLTGNTVINRTNTIVSDVSSTITPTSIVATTTIVPVKTVSDLNPQYKGIPIKSNTLTIAALNNSLFVKIGKYIYTYEPNEDKQQTTSFRLYSNNAFDLTSASDVDKQFKWVGIYDLPTKDFDKDGKINVAITFNYNQTLESIVFSLDTFDGSFDYTKQQYSFFYYGKATNYQAKEIKLDLLATLKDITDRTILSTYNIQISDDGDNLKFSTFACGQCDGDVYNGNLFYKLSTGKTELLTKRVSDFIWLTDGKYQYREDEKSIKDNCKYVFQMGVGEVPFCKLRTEDFPLNTGQFN